MAHEEHLKHDYSHFHTPYRLDTTVTKFLNDADDLEEFELNSLLGNEAVDNAEQVEDAIEPNHSKHHKHHHSHDE